MFRNRDRISATVRSQVRSLLQLRGAWNCAAINRASPGRSIGYFSSQHFPDIAQCSSACSGTVTTMLFRTSRPGGRSLRLGYDCGYVLLGVAAASIASTAALVAVCRRAARDWFLSDEGQEGSPEVLRDTRELSHYEKYALQRGRRFVGVDTLDLEDLPKNAFVEVADFAFTGASRRSLQPIGRGTSRLRLTITSPGEEDKKARVYILVKLVGEMDQREASISFYERLAQDRSGDRDKGHDTSASGMLAKFCCEYYGALLVKWTANPTGSTDSDGGGSEAGVHRSSLYLVFSDVTRMVDSHNLLAMKMYDSIADEGRGRDGLASAGHSVTAPEAVSLRFAGMSWVGMVTEEAMDGITGCVGSEGSVELACLTDWGQQLTPSSCGSVLTRFFHDGIRMRSYRVAAVRHQLSELLQCCRKAVEIGCFLRPSTIVLAYERDVIGVGQETNGPRRYAGHARQAANNGIEGETLRTGGSQHIGQDSVLVEDQRRSTSSWTFGAHEESAGGGMAAKEMLNVCVPDFEFLSNTSSVRDDAAQHHNSGSTSPDVARRLRDSLRGIEQMMQLCDDLLEVTRRLPSSSLPSLFSRSLHQQSRSREARRPSDVRARSLPSPSHSGSLRRRRRSRSRLRQERSPTSALTSVEHGGNPSHTLGTDGPLSKRITKPGPADRSLSFITSDVEQVSLYRAGIIAHDCHRSDMLESRHERCGYQGDEEAPNGDLKTTRSRSFRRTKSLSTWTLDRDSLLDDVRVRDSAESSKSTMRTLDAMTDWGNSDELSWSGRESCRSSGVSYSPAEACLLDEIREAITRIPRLKRWAFETTVEDHLGGAEDYASYPSPQGSMLDILKGWKFAVESLDQSDRELRCYKELEKEASSAMLGALEATMATFRGRVLVLTAKNADWLATRAKRCQHSPEQAAKLFKEAHLAVKSIVVLLGGDGMPGARWRLSEERLLSIEAHHIARLLDNLRLMIVAFDNMSNEDRAHVATVGEIVHNRDWLLRMATICTSAERERLSLKRFSNEASTSQAKTSRDGVFSLRSPSRRQTSRSPSSAGQQSTTSDLKIDVAPNYDESCSTGFGGSSVPTRRLSKGQIRRQQSHRAPAAPLSPEGWGSSSSCCSSVTPSMTCGERIDELSSPTGALSKACLDGGAL